MRDVCAGAREGSIGLREMTLESEASADVSAGARVDARAGLRTASDRPRSAARLRPHFHPSPIASLASRPIDPSRPGANGCHERPRKHVDVGPLSGNVAGPRMVGFSAAGTGGCDRLPSSDAMIDRSKARSEPWAERGRSGAVLERGSARVHASTGRHAGEDLAFERHLAGAERSPMSPPRTSSGL